MIVWEGMGWMAHRLLSTARRVGSRHKHRPVAVPVRHVLALATWAVLAAAAPAAATPPAARVWVTTPDGAMKMSDRGAVQFRPGGSDALTISVDPTRRYQVMGGFGASITDSSAYVLSRLNGKTRAAAMRGRFSRTDGDGLSLLRQLRIRSGLIDELVRQRRALRADGADRSRRL